MKNYRSTVVGFAILVVLMGAGAAQGLSGSDTVFSDDIKDGQVTGADIASNAIDGTKVVNSSLEGADVFANSLTTLDINESTLVPTCQVGYRKAGGVCFGTVRPAAALYSAATNCAGDRLRLPTMTEALAIALVAQDNRPMWTDTLFVDDGISRGVIINSGISTADATDTNKYRCVITIGAR